MSGGYHRTEAERLTTAPPGNRDGVDLDTVALDIARAHVHAMLALDDTARALLEAILGLLAAARPS